MIVLLMMYPPVQLTPFPRTLPKPCHQLKRELAPLTVWVSGAELSRRVHDEPYVKTMAGFDPKPDRVI